MQQKKNIELPQGAVPSCLVYWPSCFQRSADKPAKANRQRKKRSEYGSHQVARKKKAEKREKERAALQLLVAKVGDRGSVGLS